MATRADSQIGRHRLALSHFGLTKPSGCLEKRQYASNARAHCAKPFVIRPSLRTNFEGSFLYLFFGKDKVMLLDTGAGGLKIRPTIDGLIAKWLAENGRKSIPLVVAHTHGHGDHIAGDPEFAGD